MRRARAWTAAHACSRCAPSGVPSGALLAWCDEIVAAAGSFGADVVVNDRADVARMAGAAGVHVGQDDLTPSGCARRSRANRPSSGSRPTRASRS